MEKSDLITEDVLGLFSWWKPSVVLMFDDTVGQ